MTHHSTFILGERAVQLLDQNNGLLSEDILQAIELEGEVHRMTFSSPAEREAFIAGMRLAIGQGDFAIAAADNSDGSAGKASECGSRFVTSYDEDTISVKVDDDLDVTITARNNMYAVSAKYVHDSEEIAMFRVEKSDD